LNDGDCRTIQQASPQIEYGASIMEGCSALSGPWIVINTNPHRERLVLDNLQRQALTAYCPMIRRHRSHARRVETVLRPLFPSYLFLQANEALKRWRPILSTHGVRTVVRTGDSPSFIDNEFIAGLKKREVDGAVVRPASPYRVGQEVRIASGPFDGFIATILELDEKDRLLLLLDVVHRGIKIRLGGDRVMPAYGS
jgi:transcriptional antiterminator RfaH